MESHDPFGHLKYKFWPKEGLGVKLLIWFSTTKSRESPRFPCVQEVVCHMPLERSQWRLQLCFKPHLNKRCAHKVMGPQSYKSPIFSDALPTPWGTQMWIPNRKQRKSKSQGMLPGSQHFWRVKGRAGASGWGLGRINKLQLFTRTCTKPTQGGQCIVGALLVLR
jgi:hypothetical protein